ncbi:hypothetical protein KFV02_02750 [Desulfohalobiaceae bacterium Ax17]|uniref:hypothetical protein n=1 Tax=Desulfovulcanus ferrireducens TaxID=2831190 RepID=UPI00207BC657|nr:hypothetical protein [Desulfovulcanus ferrireducens]MBT8762846.1 hypothetical protein [Desulfovulcanus ferrireducens]
MTVFLTIFAGFFTFVLGQLVLKLLIGPVHEFKRTVADISHAIIEYANVYSNPGVTGEELEKKVSNEFRQLSSRLNAQMYLIPRYDLTSKIFGLPSREAVAMAAKCLIGLSNSVYKSAYHLASKNADKAERICDVLGIYVPEQDCINKKREKS